MNDKYGFSISCDEGTKESVERLEAKGEFDEIINAFCVAYSTSLSQYFKDTIRVIVREPPFESVFRMCSQKAILPMRKTYEGPVDKSVIASCSSGEYSIVFNYSHDRLRGFRVVLIITELRISAPTRMS